ncbi:hypothetical protein HOLleu_20825 [Holothuria leucospilota]|uniref:Mutator-like transposase domain-containing protein n=1 Tax=Holothuria leucospilota TaxID=206669 RepID=A0A9Q1BWP3_HOLLE|nr:hypothetical protein HOLleu_20825 [Holothuria leucospilota]
MVSRIAEEETEQQMKEAVERAKLAVLGRPPNPSETVDIVVTFDGTWAKRGFTSNFGVGVVMSADTGEVLDRKVLSKICLECCHRTGAYKGKEDYREWWDKHKEECSEKFYWVKSCYGNRSC